MEVREKCKFRIFSVNDLFLAQYKKFKTHSDAQEYLDGKIKIQKTIETKSPMSTSKISNNIPANLMKDTIQQFSTKKIVSSYRKLTMTDTNNDQGK
jgi:viroplasmin and RNaseH domain-containing protein